MMEAAVARHSLCLLSAFHYNRRERGERGRFSVTLYASSQISRAGEKESHVSNRGSATDSRCRRGDGERQQLCVWGGLTPNESQYGSRARERNWSLVSVFIV